MQKYLMNVYGTMRNIWPLWRNSLPSPQNTNVGSTQIVSHIFSTNVDVNSAYTYTRQLPVLNTDLHAVYTLKDYVVLILQKHRHAHAAMACFIDPLCVQ